MPAAPAPSAADELAVTEVAVYQAVKTTLVADGAVVPAAKQNAPIIAGRPAYVRVFVKGIGHTRPKIDGELHVKRAGKADLVLKDSGKQVVAELDDSVLDNTLNFEIAAEDVTADASFSFKTGVKLDGDTINFPADGKTIPFGAKTALQKLRVKFVPITYQADAGTSLTPDLGDMATLKDTLYKLYPVASIEITVRAPMPWSTPVKASGPGWNELLAGVMQLRRADKVDRDVYYVGVFTPVPTLDQFCASGGCILGIAPQADERDVGMRAALVLGYKNRSAGSTLAQELAHAMGRMHAPCGDPQNVDDSFPYSSGGIGVWGYDLLTKTLIDPGNRYRDFMSYCGPTWTSDYTFKGIYERMELVTQQQQNIDNGTSGMPASGGSGMNQGIEIRPSFWIANDGTVTQGPDLEVIASGLRSVSDADAEHTTTVSYEAANGNVFATAKARVVDVSGTGGRLVVAPVVPAGATHARLSGASSLVRLHAVGYHEARR
jgi:hypothetical protein